jgi:subtilisin family serine protease
MSRRGIQFISIARWKRSAWSQGDMRRDVQEERMKTRVMWASGIACVVAAVVLLTAAASAAGGADLRRIVVFREGTSEQVQQQAVAQSGSRLLHVLSLINGASIELPAVGTDGALAYLQAHDAVAGVYDDPAIGAQAEVAAIAQGGGGDGGGGDQTVFVTPVAAPTTEIYPWGIDEIGAADVQEGTPPVAGDGVKVAIFDTGVDRTHPDLAPNLGGGFNAIADADPSKYDDDNGHGTAMAGIIAARLNGGGVVGAAPHAVLYAVKVLDKNGRGHTSDTIYALGVIASRADIRAINMSFGTSLVWPLYPVAIQRAVQSGKIIVASRGNGCTATTATAQGGGGDGGGGDGGGGDGGGGDSGCNPFAVRYPAAYPEVIAVGATSANNQVASYSLWGGVDVVAPGGDSTGKILTTNLGGGYGLITGTSPAAAHVTGAVALALQLRRDLSPAQAQDLLQRTANHLRCPLWPDDASTCPSDQQGAGLIDVKAMVEELRK